MKKLLLAVMSSIVLFAFAAPAPVDAKPKSGSYSTPKKSYTPTAPSKTPNDNVSRSDQGTASKTTGATNSTASTASRGFFSGGSLFKGMLIGGLAGMLFGSMFGNMGFMGNILGFMVNLFAIVILFVAIKGIVSYFIRRRNEARTKRF